MNISGPAVVSSARAFLPSPLDANRILTIQDDLDLAPGTIQLRKGGSAKGHNGVKSFEKALGGEKGFWRLRVGIGRPEKEEVSGVRGQGVADFVLGPLSREEVHSCQWEDGKSGVLLEKVWKEVLRVGWAEEGDEVLAVQKKK